LTWENSLAAAAHGRGDPQLPRAWSPGCQRTAAQWKTARES